MENGPPRDKVDLLLLGDGYTAAEMGKWHADAKRLADILFSASPFKERKADFNVWAIDTPSEESGVARPSDGVHRRSALRAAYDAFGSERYVLAFDNQRVREAAAAAPYDVMEIVVNGRKYGGGGIFNLYATVASDNAFTPVRLRARVRPPLRGPGRRVLHVRRRLRQRGRAARALGAERHRPPRLARSGRTS